VHPDPYAKGGGEVVGLFRGAGAVRFNDVQDHAIDSYGQGAAR